VPLRRDYLLLKVPYFRGSLLEYFVPYRPRHTIPSHDKRRFCFGKEGRFRGTTIAQQVLHSTYLLN
ncbi:hypothetical protein JMJ77_0007907, partial [Colletotrichum scovillei]